VFNFVAVLGELILLVVMRSFPRSIDIGNI